MSTEEPNHQPAFRCWRCDTAHFDTGSLVHDPMMPRGDWILICERCALARQLWAKTYPPFDMSACIA